MAIIVLASATGPSAWTTYVVVGVVVALLGGLLLVLASGMKASPGVSLTLLPTLGGALLAIGAITVVGGALLRNPKIQPPKEEGELDLA